MTARNWVEVGHLDDIPCRGARTVPRGGALLRTSLMATHEREHLDRALSVFERVGKGFELTERRTHN